MPTDVAINWQKGAELTRGSAFEAGTIGVYVIYSQDNWRHGSPKTLGSSDIVYVGEGDIGARLTAHASESDSEGNPAVRQMLASGEALAFEFARTTKLQAQCLETALLDSFEDRYGHLPEGNRQAGSCGVTRSYVFGQNYDVIGAHHNAPK